MAESEHQCFTANTTAYLRNLSAEDRHEKTYAVLYQRPPEKTERGTSIGMRFPVLIVAGYVEGQQELAEKVARILNDHWEEAADG